MANAYCEAVGIGAPKLDAVVGHSEANIYSLLLVALLERGGPMTLAEVAGRFEEAGVAPAGQALASLRRCKPGRPPVYREGELYHLDPYDDELDLWAFRLGLRPAKVPRLAVVRSAPELLPGPDIALTMAELDEAWCDASLSSWSTQRKVLAILEACGEPMHPEALVAFAAARTQWHGLRGLAGEAERFSRRGSPVDVRADGKWAVAAGYDGRGPSAGWRATESRCCGNGAACGPTGP